LFISILVIAITLIARAETGTNAAQPAAIRAAVVADEQAGVIRFYIDGQELMRLDADGLHVREDVEYGGALTDTGTARFDEHATEGADAD
jgi:hypothetical protein